MVVLTSIHCITFLCCILLWSFSDSPGVPPSANAHQMFKGFSFVAPFLLEDQVDGVEMMQSHTSEKTTALSKVC